LQVYLILDTYMFILARGVEGIFERVTAEVDDGIPEGENWHLQLLNRMTFEIPG